MNIIHLAPSHMLFVCITAEIEIACQGRQADICPSIECRMSEPIPESIPTSADPKSKRAIKKRALTPVSQQASQLDALFAKPDRDIAIPTSSTKTSHLAPPPEIVANVQGSSAGAGSGEFHVYKASRRREYERVKMMDEEVAREEADAEFRKKQEERRKKDEEKTIKNRKRREKGKAKGKNGVKDGSANGGKIESARSNAVGNGASQAGEEGRDGTAAEAIPATTAEEDGIVIHDDD